MSRLARTSRTIKIPIGHLALLAMVAFLLLALPISVFAAPGLVTYQGATMLLPYPVGTGGAPSDVVVDANGTVYVTDTANSMVLVSSQAFLGDALTGDSGPLNYVTNNNAEQSTITCSNLSGLNHPAALAITGNGTLYIADTGNGRVVATNMGEANPSASCYVVIDATVPIADSGYDYGPKQGTIGTGTFYLQSPVGLAVNEYGDLFISDATAGPHNFMWGYAYNTYYGDSSTNNPNGGYPGFGMIIRIPAGSTTPSVVMDANTPVSGNTYYWPLALLYGGYADGFAGIGDEPYYAGFFINYNTVVVNGVAAPSRIAWNFRDDQLMIADTGNGRILALSRQWLLNGMPQTPTGNANPVGSLPVQTGAPGAPWEIETTGDWNWPHQLPMAYDNEITWNPSPGNTEAPYGIAVNSQGDLFFSDANYGNVYELPHPADGNWNTTNYELNPTNGGGCMNGSCSTIPSFSWDPRGVFVDQWGTVYATDAKFDNVLVNLSSMSGGTAGAGAVNFHQVPLNSTNYEYQQLVFNIPSGVTVGSVAAYTGGVENLDFNVTNQAAQGCYNGATNETCYLWVTFLPTAPGLRRGNLALYDTSGYQIASVPLFGFAAAPQLESFPAGFGQRIETDSVTTLQPMQIALDGMNNLYVANYTGTSVVRVPPQGGSGQVLAGPPSSNVNSDYALEQATGVAVDGAGNVFASDHQGNNIVVIYASGGYSYLVIDGLGTPLSQPMELNFDAAGNLYIADSGNSRVVRVDGLFINGDTNFEGRGQVVMTTAPCFYLNGSNNCVAAGGYNLPAETGGSGFQSVTGVAVDPWQNVYISDSKNGILLAAPQSLSQVNPGFAGPGRLNWPAATYELPGVSGDFMGPQGLATDGMGNLYIADASSGGSRVIMGNFQVEYGTPFGSPRDTGFGVTVTTNTTAPGPLGSNLFGVAVDPNGNVFVPDYANNRIAAYYPTVAPTLNFEPTYVGTKSADSNKSLVVFNAGDEPLYFHNPATGLNPVISPLDFALDNTVMDACEQVGPTGTIEMPMNMMCSLNVSFTPTVPGPITGSIVATDDNLYPLGYTSSSTVWTSQTVPLTGKGLLDFNIAVPTPRSADVYPGGTAIFAINFTPVGNATFAAPVTLSYTGAPIGATVTLTPSTIVKGAGPTTVTLTVIAPSMTNNAANHTEGLGSKLAPIAFALLLMPLFGIRKARKTWQRYIAVVILLIGGLAATSALSGCSTTPSGYFGQGGTTYDYTIYVTGTSLGVSHSTSVLLTVN